MTWQDAWRCQWRMPDGSECGGSSDDPRHAGWGDVSWSSADLESLTGDDHPPTQAWRARTEDYPGSMADGERAYLHGLVPPLTSEHQHYWQAGPPFVTEYYHQEYREGIERTVNHKIWLVCHCGETMLSEFRTFDG